MSSRRKYTKNPRITKKNKRSRNRQSGGSLAGGSFHGAISQSTRSWLYQVKEKFAELKRNDTTQEDIRLYNVPFQDTIGGAYTIGKHDVRDLGVNMLHVLKYDDSQPYTVQTLFGVIRNSLQSKEFKDITLPAYIDLEKSIRAELGVEQITDFSNAQTQQFYILAIMASADKFRNQIPILTYREV
jgi:hypothetical protein